MAKKQSSFQLGIEFVRGIGSKILISIQTFCETCNWVCLIRDL